jgi:hypothetical protein
MLIFWGYFDIKPEVLKGAWTVYHMFLIRFIGLLALLPNMIGQNIVHFPGVNSWDIFMFL